MDKLTLIGIVFALVAVIGGSVLGDNRLGQAIAVNGYRAGLLIKFRLKRLG